MGTILCPWVDGKPQSDFLVVVEGGVAPRSVLPPKAGEYAVDGEPLDQWGVDEWAVVKKGTGKLVGSQSVDRTVTAWWKANT